MDPTGSVEVWRRDVILLAAGPQHSSGVAINQTDVYKTFVLL